MLLTHFQLFHLNLLSPLHKSFLIYPDLSHASPISVSAVHYFLPSVLCSYQVLLHRLPLLRKFFHVHTVLRRFLSVISPSDSVCIHFLPNPSVLSAPWHPPVFLHHGI